MAFAEQARSLQEMDVPESQKPARDMVLHMYELASIAENEGELYNFGEDPLTSSQRLSSGDFFCSLQNGDPRNFAFDTQSQELHLPLYMFWYTPPLLNTDGEQAAGRISKMTVHLFNTGELMVSFNMAYMPEAMNFPVSKKSGIIRSESVRSDGSVDRVSYRGNPLAFRGRLAKTMLSFTEQFLSSIHPEIPLQNEYSAYTAGYLAEQ